MTRGDDLLREKDYVERTSYILIEWQERVRRDPLIVRFNLDD